MSDLTLRFSFDFKVETDLLRLSVLPVTAARGQLANKMGECVIRLPHTYDFGQPQMQVYGHKVLAEALRWQAQRYLPQRVAQIAEVHGISYGRVTIKRMSSRWGSCSSLRNLNFSLYLMLLPRHLVDYVICHELAHLKQMNHSPAFWTEVDHLTGGAGRGKRLQAECKAYVRKWLSVG